MQPRPNQRLASQAMAFVLAGVLAVAIGILVTLPFAFLDVGASLGVRVLGFDL